MKKLFLVLLFPFLVFGQYSKQDALNSISKDEIFENLGYLASDSLKGRAAGSEGNLLAAMYIADKFKKYGLKPLIKKEAFGIHKPEVDEDSKDFEYSVEDAPWFNEYFQRFSFEKTTLTENNTLSVIRETVNGSLQKSYSFGIDFIIQYYGAADLDVEASVVMAGYGINKGENDYNDYIDSTGREIDVQNKIVIIMDGFPQQADTSSIFSKARSPLYRNPLRKAEVALDKGALAVILISSPLMNDPQIQVKYDKLSKAFLRGSDHLLELPKRSLPIIYASRNVVQDIFEKSGINIKEYALEIENTLKANPVELKNKRIKYSVRVKNELIPTQNVIGFIEGTDPILKNEVIVIGAHYDHVGLGFYGAMRPEDKGKIHNGADDNASGTSGIIELAEAFSKSKPKRSLLFAAFTAEENGLIGSKYYVYEQPLKPLDKTIAMLNLDMISRNNEKLLWVGGAFYSDDLRMVVEKVNKETGFELLYNVGLLTNASDQAVFLRKQIPALFFFAGDHKDYHTPDDDIDKVSLDKIRNVCRLVYLTAEEIANREEKPVYESLSMEKRSELVKDSNTRQHLYKR